jgi:uroporphyrinogen-III synthase/uroporphyrinogen III methyltransferase/synthase
VTAAQPLVAVTRDERADDQFSRMLSTLGAACLPLQTIAIKPAKDVASLTAALEALDRTDWIVFTSAHAVDATCGHASWQRLWRRRPGRTRVAAIGTATAARLAERGVEVDLVPAAASAAGLVAALVERTGDLRKQRIVWPRSDVARRELPDALAAAGATVVDPAAYRTVAVRPPGLSTFLKALEAGEVDAIAFLSPSSALGLAAALPGSTLALLRGRTIVASIGPTTSAALAGLGAPVDIEAPERSTRSLAEAIVGAARRQGAKG